MSDKTRRVSVQYLIMSHIHIPTELKMKILESLPGDDIARVSCVCSEYRNLASENSLW